MDAESSEPLPTALVVDDEKEVADAYALRLRGCCSVETVYDGESALATVAESDIDVVLLDRHMPGMSGDDVLQELDDRDFEGAVIMVTAIDPGFDVLDMPFDDYLCKPIEREDVRATVNQQCEILGYELLGEFFSLESTCRVIEAELPAEKLDEHEEYQETRARADRLKQRARRLLDDASETFETFDSVERESR
jgi:DNA-binding response OmpR family regulator